MPIIEQKNICSVVNDDGEELVIAVADLDSYEEAGFVLQEKVDEDAEDGDVFLNDDPDESDGLDDLNMVDLNVIADDEDIHIPSNTRKGDMISIIREHRAALVEDEEVDEDEE